MLRLNLVSLSSALDNDILNSSKIDVDSTPTSITELLCNKVFGGVPDISKPHFLGFFCSLACSIKQ